MSVCVGFYRRVREWRRETFESYARRSEGSPIGDTPYIADFLWSDLLGYYWDRSLISSGFHNRVLRYPAELAAYIASQKQPI